jgi:hypothetical protein
MHGIMQAGMEAVREIMHGIMQAGMIVVVVREEERGNVQDRAGWDSSSEGEERLHARNHAGWDRSREGRGVRSCTGSCKLGW